MLYYEQKASRNGFNIIIGVDEAGRGPLAGPVVAAAVWLKSYTFQNKIDDSKSLSAAQREKAFFEIFENAQVGIGIISEAVIDTVNILEATYLAMSSAVHRLIRKFSNQQTPDPQFSSKVCLLIDGPAFKSSLPFTYEPIINGDALSLSVACASIVAKVTRDRILESYDRILPQYGFKQHKGYPTRAHKMAIQEHGLSFIHRRTFQHTL